MAQDDTSHFPESIVTRGAIFVQLEKPHWSSPGIAHCKYASGTVRLTARFSDWKGPPSQWVTWSAESGRGGGKLGVTGTSAPSPEAALEAADHAAANELTDIDSRIAELTAWRRRIERAQEALEHPGDAACEHCRAEIVDPEATGVICRACFDAGPLQCVECGAPAHGLVCSPRCAVSADLCWDDWQKVPS